MAGICVVTVIFLDVNEMMYSRSLTCSTSVVCLTLALYLHDEEKQVKSIKTVTSTITVEQLINIYGMYNTHS